MSKRILAMTIATALAIASLALAGADALAGNLVANPSFENDGGNTSALICPISDWSGCSGINAGVTATRDPILAGHFAYLAIGTVGSLGYVSQTISTVAGQKYAFSFEFSSDGAPGNRFQAVWDGAILIDVTDSAFNPGWPLFDGTDVLSFSVTADSAASTISFGGQGNGTSFIGVDGVGVDAVPEPASIALLGAVLGTACLGLRRRAGR
jgi:hypothetical protein